MALEHGNSLITKLTAKRIIHLKGLNNEKQK